MVNVKAVNPQKSFEFGVNAATDMENKRSHTPDMESSESAETQPVVVLP
jgi:hypothetical protein